MLELPAGFVTALAGLVVLLQLASAFSVEVLHARPASAGLLAAFLVGWVVVAFLLAPARPECRASGAGVGAATGGAAVLVVYAVAAAALGSHRQLEWFLGGDNVRHVVLVSDVLHDGNLSYQELVYPRAWHALLATGWAAGRDPEIAERDLTDLVVHVSFSTWLLGALLSLSVATLTLRLLRRYRMRTWTLCLGVAGAGLGVVTPRLLADYLSLGFQTSILAALVASVAMAEVARGPRTLFSPAVLGACIAAMAHSWQLLLPGVSFLGAFLAAEALGRRERRHAVVVLTAAAFAVGASVAPVLTVSKRIGLSGVATPGAVPHVPWLLLAAGAVAVAAFLPRPHGRRMMAALAAAAALPGVTAGSLVVVRGLEFSDYYPAKLMWTSAVLVVPFVAAGAAVAVDRGLGAGSARTVLGGVGVAAMSLVLVWGALTPLGAARGYWSPVDAATVLDSASAPAASRARAVWVGSPLESALTRTLLYAYRPDRLGAGMSDRLTVSDECALLLADARPTVLTTRSAGDAERRYSCVPAPEVVVVR